jgi:chemotaxis family two-component system sensor kinase Cph1
MSNFQVNLSNCDREQIHVPGQIQSHGFLIVLDKDTCVTYFSDNVFSFIPEISRDLLGTSLAYLESFIGLAYQPYFLKNLIASSSDNFGFEKTNPVPVEIGGSNFFLIISKTAGQFLLEFEEALSVFELGVQLVLGQSIAHVLAHKSIDKLLQQAAFEVKEIIAFDRVMIYQFMEDGHGMVAAECKNDDLEPWLGLHYPASDIPQQARALYKLNLTRLIADVHSVPSKITTSADNLTPLDLTNSQLRAVSPIHIQYLKNMGVVSSFSISIICNGELWGLIACHNYSARFIDFKSREYAKLIGQILSSALQFRSEEVDQHEIDALRSSVRKLSKVLLGKQDIFSALASDPQSLLQVVPSNGVLLAAGNKSFRYGLTPDMALEKRLLEWLFANVDVDVFSHTNLSSLFPEGKGFEKIVSGFIFCLISREKQECLIWFRPEQIYNVNWAGNPDKPVVIEQDSILSISPRVSFEIWKQAVTGVSEEWKKEEINAVQLLKQEILSAASLKAGAVKEMNERLREAYEELETFSYTISHDLKNPLASIKTYAQLLIRDKKLEARGQLMVQRIADRADQMNLMINAVLNYSKIGQIKMNAVPMRMEGILAEIIDDLVIVYDEHAPKITVDITHDLYGDEVMLHQIFSNLVGNAVKYSQKSSPPVVKISSIIDNNEVIYTISDNGLGIPKRDQDKIFELFNRMDNVHDIEGSGVGLAIVKRIIEKHKGRIWVESEIGIGSTFYVGLPKPM